MKKAKRCLIAVVSGVLVAAAVLSGCGQSKKEVSKNDDHLSSFFIIKYSRANCNIFFLKILGFHL